MPSPCHKCKRFRPIIEVPAISRYRPTRHLPEFDRLSDDLKVIERDLARPALADKQLMTILAVDMVVALALVAAIGDIERFARPEQLVGQRPTVNIGENWGVWA